MAKAATKPKSDAAPSINMPDVKAGNLKAALTLAESTAKSTMLMLDPNKLRIIPGFNVRIHETADYAKELDELKVSIKKNGFMLDKPLAGFVGKDGEEDVIFVTDGHRRLEAVKLAITDGAEVTSIPVVVKPNGTSMVDLTAALVTSNTGRRFSMFENAIVVRRLQKAGLDEDAIAEKLNFTKRGVSDFLVLITAPKAIRDLAKMERISGTEAVRILRKFADKPKEAEAKILEMVAKADARGATKASRKDSGDAPVRAKTGDGEEGETKSKVRMHSVETKWSVSAGQEFQLSETRYFAKLFGDTDWYLPMDDKAGWATAVEDVSFRGIVTRPKKDEAPAEKTVEGEEGEGDEAGDEPETGDEAEVETGTGDASEL